MSFQDVDRNVKEVLAPTFEKAEDLITRVRYILDKLGKRKGRILKKRTEYKSKELKLVENRPFISRRYRVFYRDDLVFHTSDWKTIYKFRDGPWVAELVPLYLQAKLVFLREAFGIEGLEELCDFFDHDTGQCGKDNEKTCPCIEFSSSMGGEG